MALRDPYNYMDTGKNRIKLKVPDQALDELVVLSQNASVLPRLIEAIKAVPSLDRTLLAKAFAKKADVDLEKAESIIAALISLHGVRTAYELTPESLYEEVTRGLEAKDDKRWPVEAKNAWIRNRELIVVALDGRSPISLVQKAVRLAYAYQNIVVCTEILTDIRPVFDEDPLSVGRALITQTLVIEYHDHESKSDKRLCLVLDAADIKKIRSDCDRAEKKASLLDTSLEQAGWAVIPATNV